MSAGFVALIISALRYAVPLGISAVEGPAAKLAAFAPIRSIQTFSVFWIEPFNVAGHTFFFALPVVLFAVAAACICQAVAGKRFAKHRVRCSHKRGGKYIP